MEWEWWQVVIGVVVAILAIRITATINVTEWLKHRDERAVRNLRSLCPHTEIEVSEGGEIKVQSTGYQPDGTVDWGLPELRDALPRRTGTRQQRSLNIGVRTPSCGCVR